MQKLKDSEMKVIVSIIKKTLMMIVRTAEHERRKSKAPEKHRNIRNSVDKLVA